MENTPFDDALPVLPPQTPVTKGRPRKRPFLIVATLLVVAALATGGYFFAQKRAEEQQLAELRGRLKAVVLADNALALEVLELDESSHITYAEYFKRTEKNKENRADLIRQIRAIEAGPYQKAATNFVALMEIESEFVRADEDLSRQNMQLSSRREAVESAYKARTNASGEVDTAFKSYMAAPYGNDYSEKSTYEIAKMRLDAASTTSKENLAAMEQSEKDFRTKLGAAALAVSDWIREEQTRYPYDFAPPRDVMRLLKARKSAYSVRLNETPGGDNELAAPKATKASAPIGSAITPTATPMPAAPTRDHSTTAMEGERFPATRMRTITFEDTANYSAEDLRYAINEMYARYGMTFKSRAIQSSFTGRQWYHPDDRWTPSQIERQFTGTEKANMRILVQERDSRQGTGE